MGKSFSDGAVIRGCFFHLADNTKKTNYYKDLRGLLGFLLLSKIFGSKGNIFGIQLYKILSWKSEVMKN
ncbi:hypothetical protein K7X08_001827 [Anisodus acutangulus]|uniref:Uncharacterized protein n=1 Tax=Anisodus acutangulus TaxID=402998 RepID=A0A9Q1R6R6_9SOLA|nr:hypothetical protein K7X08_001827 [Anisodus acutangulus]